MKSLSSYLLGRKIIHLLPKGTAFLEMQTNKQKMSIKGYQFENQFLSKISQAAPVQNWGINIHICSLTSKDFHWNGSLGEKKQKKNKQKKPTMFRLSGFLSLYKGIYLVYLNTWKKQIFLAQTNPIQRAGKIRLLERFIFFCSILWSLCWLLVFQFNIKTINLPQEIKSQPIETLKKRQ